MTLSFRFGVAAVLLTGSAAVCQTTPAPAANPVPVPAPASTPAAPVQVVPSPVAPPALAPGQNQKPGDQQDADTPFRLNVRANLVNLVFTVTDRNGRFKKDLRREDFGLLDDGRPPAAVIAFTQQTNLPLRIGIMLDTSSSIRTRFKFEQDAAQDFFYQVLKSRDRAFVEGFDIQVALTQDYNRQPRPAEYRNSKTAAGWRDGIVRFALTRRAMSRC